MSLFITSLNSGSNGNCYYVGNGTEAVLIDAGISCREIEKRMRRLQLDLSTVQAILVSHEHGDHIAGVPGLSKKYRLPVYITQHTLQSSGIPVADDLVRSFTPYTPVTVGNLSITAFPKFHDAVDPHSFIVAGNGVRIGVFTDIGSSCTHVVKHFRQCHAVFLESNYCEQMLQNGNYPYYLKQRIRGGHDHLSNTQALDLFRKHRSSYLSHLILAHLSKNNNSPELVNELFTRHAGNVKVVVASRYQETEVFCVHGNGEAVAPVLPEASITQLSLF